jgi:hypothetical protein
MPRQKNASPSYLLHQRSGQARVRLEKDGRVHEHYLGPYGSPESWEMYHRLVAEHLQKARGDVSGAAEAAEDLGIAELVVQYDEFSREYYVKDGEITNDRFRAVVNPLVSLYGGTPARDFSPNKLRAVREYIIHRGNANQAEYDERGELVRPGDPLSRSHKLDWQGIEKEILLGPRAQALLGPWLEGRGKDAYLFSPKEVTEASYRRRRTRSAKKPRKSRRRRPPREHYTDDTYRRAVQRVCRELNIPPWSPGWLQHNAGTEVRQEFGVKAAQLVLGRNLRMPRG